MNGDTQKMKKRKAEPLDPDNLPLEDRDLIAEDNLPKYGTWFCYFDLKQFEYARVHFSKHEGGTPYRYVADGQWERRPPQQLWPYRITTIGETLPVLVVAQEQAARAISESKFLDGRMAVVAWMGDEQAWHLTNWEPLRRRKVVLWPANTPAEREAMQRLAPFLKGLRCEVYLIRVPQEKPIGWGPEDVMADGENAIETFPAFINANLVLYEVNPFLPVKVQDEDREKLSQEFKVEDDLVFLSKSAAGLRQALKVLQFQTRYNERSHLHEIRRVTADGQIWANWYERLGLKKGWTPMSDFLEAHLLDQLQKRFKIAGGHRPYYLKSDEFKRAFLSVQLERHVDDFRAWLDDLPLWDQEPRLSDMAETILGVRPVDKATDRWFEFLQHVSRTLLVGPVQRTYEPGCELDETVVLLGAGGIGKTKFYSYLFPTEKYHWYVGPLDFADDRKSLIEMVSGAVVVEAGEMVVKHLRYAQRNKMLDFLTRQQDKIRQAYGRHAQTTERRFVIIGTANPSTSGTLYYDDNHHRRFIVVDVYGCAKGSRYATDYLRANHAQLWAEAIHWYRSGYRAKLPDHLQFWRMEGVKMHTEYDELFIERLRDLEDAIRVNRTGLLYGYDESVGLAIHEIAKGANLYKEEFMGKTDVQLIRRVADALRQDGWAQRRVVIDGERRNRWFLPERKPQEEA